MGLYLDNKEVECGQDASTANCDSCGEGVTALERHNTRAARERQTVEETLDEVTDGCVFCFIQSTGESGVSWAHRLEDCEEAEYGKWHDLDEKFRRLIRFEEGTHSRLNAASVKSSAVREMASKGDVSGRTWRRRFSEVSRRQGMASPS